MSLASAWCLIKLVFAMWASVLVVIGLIGFAMNALMILVERALRVREPGMK